jgi:hypothetical protein
MSPWAAGGKCGRCVTHASHADSIVIRARNYARNWMRESSSSRRALGSRWGMRNSAMPSKLLAKHAAPSHFLGLAWLGVRGKGKGEG